MRILLQARTSSQRLPAKSLLPIGGYPLAVLCAKRLSSQGASLVLVTSNDVSDDELSLQAEAQGIQVFRGDLQNVAQRFLDCTADLGGHETIVRATADNPVPNGALVDAMVQDFQTVGGDYLGPDSYPGMPQGLGVEVFRLGRLREDKDALLDPMVREHVTLAIRRAGVASVKSSELRFDGSTSPRLTVDTLDDYLIAARAFRSVDTPTTAPWRQIVSAFQDVEADCDINR